MDECACHWYVGRSIHPNDCHLKLADAFTAMTYGKANGLLEYGRAPEVLAFTELNWNPYFWAVMIPPLGRFAKLAQALVIGSKVLLSGGKPPLPILGVSKKCPHTKQWLTYSCSGLSNRSSWKTLRVRKLANPLRCCRKHCVYIQNIQKIFHGHQSIVTW